MRFVGNMLAGVALTPFAAALATKTVTALAVDGRQLSDAGLARDASFEVLRYDVGGSSGLSNG